MLRALIAAFLSAPFALAPAAAQEWPSRTINVIVPLGAGSASDILARVVMEQVGKQLGQAAIVENRPGAGGTIGANMVAKAAPDGYTVLVYGALASAHALHEKLPYDSVNDLIPIASLGQQILVVISSPGKGYKTLGDLVAAAKAKPGALNYSSAGVGSSSHMGAERLRASVGFEAQHIPFKGAAEAVTDVIAGRSDFSVQLPATTLPLLKDGKLTALVNIGPANPREFAEVTSTTDVLAPIAGATGGDARRLEAGNSINVPRLLAVRSGDTYKGDDWLGMKMRDASVVRGIGVLPVFAGLLGLLLLLGSLAGTWAREGR